MRLRISCSIVQQRDHQVAKLAIFRCLVFCTMAFPTSLTAATYYVDFLNGLDTNNGTSKATPWNHAPGMTGCTSTCNSTTPTDGDTVIFKGGVTWTGSFPWSPPGGSSSMVTYTTDHTWYSGGAWSQPAFDDGGVDRAGGAFAIGASYITINDFTIQNCGNQPTVVSSHECMVLTSVHDITITNSTFRTNDWIAIYFLERNNGTDSNITITGNDFANTSNGIWLATYQASVVISNVNINNNVFHDFYTSMVGGTHGNGFFFYTSPDASAGQYTAYATGVTFCNNRFYGDFSSYGAPYTGGSVGGGMTAFFHTSDSLSGVVCNNDFSFINPGAGYGTGFNSLIAVTPVGHSGPNTTIQIYNNSLVNAGSSAMSAGINMNGFFSGDSVVLKNNIASGMQNCIYAQDSGTVTALSSDYNLWNCTGGPLYAFRLVSTYYSYSSWQSAGYDTHGVLGRDPLWVAAPGNEHLSAGSPAILAGANLSGLGVSSLSTDAAGVLRPASTAWDIGAFQGSAVLSPPSGLKAVVR